MAPKPLRRARSKRRRIDRAFYGLRLQGKEFNLPKTSSPSLSKEFVVYPDVSNQMKQETYPTTILDDSCVSEVMIKPSIPLVESVEAFFWGQIDNPFGRSPVEPNADAPLNNQESHGLPPVTIENEECLQFSADSSKNQTAQSDANASTPDSQLSSTNPQPSLVNDRLPVPGGQVLNN
uniref:Uncharacterized protein n=1 Tax=Chenopodium quinoa TaxID=63459 RepID=A0A803KM78_CHEQI